MSIGGIVISDALRYKKNIINPICVGLEIKKKNVPHYCLSVDRGTYASTLKEVYICA